MSVIKAVRDYIKTCPILNVNTATGTVGISVDYLEDDTTSYSLEEVPEKTKIKEYLDGSSIRQATFLFCSKEPYGPDVLQQLENSGFYEDFSDWLERNSNRAILPLLDSGKEAIKIEAITRGYAYITDTGKAIYQIQISLKYFQERMI